MQVGLRQGELASQRVGDRHAEQAGPFSRQNAIGGIFQGNGLLRLDSERLQGSLIQGGIGLRVQHIVATFDAEKMLTELKAGEMAMDPGTRGAGRHANVQIQTSGLGKIIVDSRQDSLNCNEGITALALLCLDKRPIDYQLLTGFQLSPAELAYNRIPKSLPQPQTQPRPPARP